MLEVALFSVMVGGILGVGEAECAISTTWTQTGTLKPVLASDASVTAEWSIGAETMDRNYTIFANWRDYVGKFGAKRARVQAGWARCDPHGSGAFEFEWLDEIVDGMLSVGVRPWLQTSYGNSAVPGGGNEEVSSPLPSGTTALARWDEWVAALTQRYEGKVDTYELWNEFNVQHISAADYAVFAAHTAAVLRSTSSKPLTIYAGVVAGIDINGVTSFLTDAGSNVTLFDAITFHPYAYNPDSTYDESDKLLEAVQAIGNKYNHKLTIVQGENGAPSVGGDYGALGDYPWTECSQAKWDARRLVGDAASGMKSNLFSAIDMCYDSKINTKGTIQAHCPDKTVVGPKMAFSVSQLVFSLFRSSGSIGLPKGTASCSSSAVVAVAYGLPTPNSWMLGLWDHTGTPVNASETRTTLVSATVSLPPLSTDASQFSLIDILNGNIYSVPSTNVNIAKTSTIFHNIPTTDAPVFIIPTSEIPSS